MTTTSTPYPVSISVCIPVYNAAAYLKECLDSICAQSFHDFEILIADDGYTDESAQIAASYPYYTYLRRHCQTSRRSRTQGTPDFRTPQLHGRQPADFYRRGRRVRKTARGNQAAHPVQLPAHLAGQSGRSRHGSQARRTEKSIQRRRIPGRYRPDLPPPPLLRRL